MPNARLFFWMLLLVTAGTLGCREDVSADRQGLSLQCGTDTALTCEPPDLTGQILKSVQIDSAGAVFEHYFGEGSTVRQDHGAYIVEIRRTMTNAELWVLEEPLSNHQQTSGRAICFMRNGPGSAPCKDVPVAPESATGDISSVGAISPANRAQALVQINGFTFNGTASVDIASYPTTRLFESGYRVSDYGLADTDYDSPEYIMTFGAHGGSGPTARLIAPPASCRQAGPYNAFGTTWPLMVGSKCLCSNESGGAVVHPGQSPGGGEDTDAFPVIGYSNTKIVMMILQTPYNTTQKACKLLSTFGVTDAVQLDSGPSAGMLINSPAAFKGTTTGPVTIGTADYNASYHLGLVALDFVEALKNPDFEWPAVTEPSGRKPINASNSPDYRAFDWTVGGVSLDGYGPNVWLYTKLVQSQPTPSPERPVASGNQAVAIRPGNFMSQTLDLPNDRYCMLHFSHGYNRANPSCANSGSPAESSLQVSANNEHPMVARFHAREDGRLHPEWLRFVTSPSGKTRLAFQALPVNPDSAGSSPYGANCEVLVDDVRVECATSIAASASTSAGKR